jgi:hypothetical protein
VRVLIGLLLKFHGVMAWPGFAVPWRLLTIREVPFTTELAFGAVDVGEPGIQLFGVLWMVTIVLFIVGGIAYAMRWPWAVPLIAGTAAFQIVLAVLNVPWTWEGVVLDVFILALISLDATGRLPALRRA